jgi:hypothetical protein
MGNETLEQFWTDIGNPILLQYQDSTLEAERIKLGLFLLLPAVVGVLLYIGELDWVAYNDAQHQILKYTMCMLVHMWLAACVAVHFNFAAECKKKDELDSRLSIFVWMFNTCIKFESNFLNNVLSLLGGYSLFCDGKKLVGFPFPDFKSLVDMTVVCICWVHGGGRYVPFNDADMSDIFWWYLPYIILSAVLVLLSQLPGFICAVESLLTFWELIIDFLRFGGICMLALCIWNAFIFVVDLVFPGVRQFFNASKTQLLAGSQTLTKIFGAGTHAPAGPQIPTDYNINQITTELVEAKPGAPVWAGRSKTHHAMMKHVHLYCTIKGLTPDDFEEKGVKPVIEAAGIVWNKDSKRIYCQKELRRVHLLA